MTASKDNKTESGKKLMTSEEKALYKKVYLECRDQIFYYIYKKINNKGLAEDFSAEVFIKLYDHKNIMEDRDINGVKAWLYTVARNRMVDYFRKGDRKNKPIDVDDDTILAITGKEIGYLQNEIQSERESELLNHMEKLSEGDKEVLMLRFKEELQFSEIAEVVDKNEGAVKMQVYRALDKLEQSLQKKSELFKSFTKK